MSDELRLLNNDCFEVQRRSQQESNATKLLIPNMQNIWSYFSATIDQLIHVMMNNYFSRTLALFVWTKKFSDRPVRGFEMSTVRDSNFEYSPVFCKKNISFLILQKVMKKLFLNANIAWAVVKSCHRRWFLKMKWNYHKLHRIQVLIVINCLF